MTTPNLLLCGQYKVIQILRRQPEFAVVQAVDILDRQHPIRLLNIYEGKEALRHAAIFMNLRHNEAFLQAQMEGESLIAVFQWRDAMPIDRVFYRDSGQEHEERLEYARLLFLLALELSDQPPEIGCCALKSENLCVLPKDKKLWVNYCLSPMAGATHREIICLVADQAKKILLDTWTSSLTERRFLARLEHGYWTDAVRLNSAWNSALVEIRQEYERQINAGMIKRFFALLIRNVRWARERKNEYGA